MITLDVALIGFGNVGRRLARLLREREAVLRDDFDLRCRIVAIATATHGCAFDPNGLDAPAIAAAAESGRSVDEFGTAFPPKTGLDTVASLAQLETPNPRVVIETTVLNVTNGQPAVDHVRAALAAGVHVVSANKGPVALAYADLKALSQRRGAHFLFESAVMDGIPVFNLVRDTLPAIQVLGFRGVVNSTTNHILTEMEAGRSYDEALAAMQAAGIAEADPSLDVDGWDAAAKTAALVNVLLDGSVTPADVRRTGITGLSGDEVRHARAEGRRIKLVASATRGGAHAHASVEPVPLPLDDPLAQVTGMANALVLDTDLLGRVGITQLDGGLTQTAYGLLTDLVALRKRLRAPRATRARRTL